MRTEFALVPPCRDDRAVGLLDGKLALITGAAYIVSGASDMALIIGGDCNSRVVNPDDLKTYPLFGDGAGAVLLARGGPDQGILSYSLGADGSGGDLLSRPACGSRMPPSRIQPHAEIAGPARRAIASMPGFFMR